MSSLITLPQEILLQILEYVVPFYEQEREEDNSKSNSIEPGK